MLDFIAIEQTFLHCCLFDGCLVLVKTYGADIIYRPRSLNF